MFNLYIYCFNGFKSFIVIIDLIKNLYKEEVKKSSKKTKKILVVYLANI
jgi:hypothetical protein